MAMLHATHDRYREARPRVFALRHRSRLVLLWPAAAFLGLHALEPANFAVPLLGLVDDFVLLPLVLHFLLKFLPSDIRAGFGQKFLAR